MINGSSGNQSGRISPVLEKLVATVNRASPEKRSELAGIVRMVSDAYPGQAEQSWETIGRMREAISSGSIEDYKAARESDPHGKLAQIVGVMYAKHPVRNQKQLELLLDWESSYIAEHLERV